LSLSRSLAVSRSRIGGSTVLRGKHPCDRARPGIGIVRQQARMGLGDMKYDRPCLEKGEIAFLIGRNLAERMKRPIRGFLHRTERNEANLVGLAHLFKCPANARITRRVTVQRR
jgi:hypothetical protein